MYVFIGGVPTAGKTHLTKDYISNSNLDIKHIEIDKLRDSLVDNKDLERWVNYFRNINEVEYWKKTSCEQHINNVRRQTKALWPHILEKIKNLKSKHQHIIFEGVSIEPELARKYLDFDGFFLISRDIETTYIRLKAHMRWGKSDILKRKEAKCFYQNGIEYISIEAKKYGFKIFDNIEDGYHQLANFFNI